MWIFTRTSFLSIVEDDHDSKLMHVRARAPEDISRLFPEADVIEGIATDFRFHARIPRTRVTAAVERAANQIDYTEFKNTIDEPERRDAYMRVWESMREFQTEADPRENPA